MKYIMLEVKIGTLVKKVPVIFPNELVHILVAFSFEKAIEAHGWEMRKVLSGGEISFDDVEVSGESTTMKVKSNKEDERTIQLYDYLHGL